jgi:DNA processing protein
MENQNLYWIWLTRRPGLGPVKLRRLLEQFGGPEALYAADAQALARAGVSETARRALLDKDLEPARSILRSCKEKGLHILTLGDADYPSALGRTADAPVLLYCKGELPGAGRQPWIGLVGARRADAKGLALARQFGWQIVGCGGVVVTGMAKGIDAEAAWGALDRGGRVVGVLGCGPDLVYPKENAALYEKVAAQGCLLSEYPPGVQPDARHFPARNRIISALSDGVTVVQASEQSGALITARWAVSQGREVFAVPGPAGESLSRGCNQLLREGALLAENGWDIMREYYYRYPGAVRECRELPPPRSPEAASAAPQPSEPAAPPRPQAAPRTETPQQPAPPPADLTPPQRRILEALQGGPVQLDTLIDKTGLPAAQVLPQLTLLQIKKIITQLPGKQYTLSGG